MGRESSWHDWGFLRTAYIRGDPSCGGSVGACATVAAKALESAVSTLGSGSKHWGVDVHSACGY